MVIINSVSFGKSKFRRTTLSEMYRLVADICRNGFDFELSDARNVILSCEASTNVEMSYWWDYKEIKLQR